MNKPEAGKVVAAFLVTSLVTGCGVDVARQKLDARAAVTDSAPRLLTAAGVSGRTGAAPRLVVALIYDQLGSDTLLLHSSLLDPAGAIHQALDRGVYIERSVYPYANTLTAPGHVAIHTGAAPTLSGVDGNSAWDAARGHAMPVTDDPRYPVFGRERDSVSAGPAKLRVPTVAEALKSETRGAAKVVSLSLKDRSAILSVGSAADLVLWYDAKLGAFTSSSAWSTALPEWFRKYQAEHPLSGLFRPWVAESPGEYAARLGLDAAPGEGDLYGWGTTFPHVWESVTKPLSVLSCTPMLSEYLVALAGAAVEAGDLGKDAVPDLLALSISGTDSAGHVFGPSSWEYIDHLVRADRAAGAWLTRLEQITDLAVVITSDHGVAALPETRPGGGRIFPEQIQDRLEAALARRFGQGPWLAGVMAPYVYLSAKAREHKDFARILEQSIVELRKENGLRAAWPVSEVRGWADDVDPLRRSLAWSVAPDTKPDIMFLTLPYYTVDLREPRAKGTNHGSPYDYDTMVPVLAWGISVPRLRQSEPAEQLRVAATLARLLGVPAPAQAAEGSLF